MESLIKKLSQTVPGTVFRDGDPEYQESLASYFSAQESEIKPACVVKPGTAIEVSMVVSALAEANSERQDKLKFAIRSGGHASFAESANEPEGVTIDLRRLNSIKISNDQTQVTIGAGASWGEVYRTLDAQGLAVPGGRHSQVGVGGLTLGDPSGGVSHFSGHVGLVCDNVLEYEIIFASGFIARVTEDTPEYKDLFFALRGGSNNFGIVTRFAFRVFRQGRLWGGTLIHGVESKDQQLNALNDFAANPKYDPSASLIQSFGMSEQGSGIVNGIVYTKLESEPSVFKPFLNIDPIHVNTLRELTLTELTLEQDKFNQGGPQPANASQNVRTRLTPLLSQLMTSTTFYLSLSLLRLTYSLWHTSSARVKPVPGIVWSMNLHALSPSIISKSPFLQSAIPSLTNSPRTIIIAHLTATWTSSSSSSTVETAARDLITSIEAAAREEGLQTGYMYLNYAHVGQEVWSDGSERGEKRKEWLRGVSRRVDPEGVFQECVSGGFKLF
ncbi:MAG: hypothetical protein Q9160_007700 [Pyrenula sp. 1 TL-2023]